MSRKGGYAFRKDTCPLCDRDGEPTPDFLPMRDRWEGTGAVGEEDAWKVLAGVRTGEAFNARDPVYGAIPGLREEVLCRTCFCRSRKPHSEAETELPYELKLHWKYDV
jgi:hypothetical protein